MVVCENRRLAGDTLPLLPLPLVICHVLPKGIYIASSLPLGHHHSLQYIQTHPLSTSTACPGRDIIRRRNYLLLLPYSTKTTILRRGALWNLFSFDSESSIE
jgi:hypothetical protein